MPVNREKKPANQVNALYGNAYENIDRTEGVFADIFRRLESAESHIMISGWAVDLAMDFGNPTGKTLGEAIVRAAKRGVKIYISAWDRDVEPGWYPLKQRLHNNVDYLEELLGRSTPIKRALVRKNIAFRKTNNGRLGYTDHRKMVIVDDTLFMGGLDLTSGRDDTPEHYYSEYGNWRDAHIAAQGAVAMDAARDFADSFAAQRTTLYGKADPEAVNFSLEAAQEFIRQRVGKYQVNENQASLTLLSSAKKLSGSKSADDESNPIQDAYLKVIQEAREFIYIEQQYLIGDNHDTIQSHQKRSANQIPRALVDKIFDQAKEGKPFHVYIVLPQRPDGNEDLPEVDIVLREQWDTMRWMIEELNTRFAKDIPDKKPSDFLTFMNIGQVDYIDQSYKQVYVHSKLMIVDNEQLLIGSANINERSMAMGRDREVALQVNAKEDPKVGRQVQDFLSATLQEHFPGQENLTVAGVPDRHLIQKQLDENHDALHQQLGSARSSVASEQQETESNQTNETVSLSQVKKIAMDTLMMIKQSQRVRYTHQSRKDGLAALEYAVRIADSPEQIKEAFEQVRHEVEMVRRRSLFQFRSTFVNHCDKFLRRYEGLTSNGSRRLYTTSWGNVKRSELFGEAKDSQNHVKEKSGDEGFSAKKGKPSRAGLFSRSAKAKRPAHVPETLKPHHRVARYLLRKLFR